MEWKWSSSWKIEKTQLVITWTLTSSKNNLTFQRSSINWTNKLQPTQRCTYQFSGPLCNVWFLLWNHFLQCCLREEKKEKPWNKHLYSYYILRPSIRHVYERSHWLFLQSTKTRIQNCSLIALTQGPKIQKSSPQSTVFMAETWLRVTSRKKTLTTFFFSLSNTAEEVTNKILRAICHCWEVLPFYSQPYCFC